MKELKLKVIAISIGLLFSFLIGELIARVYFFGGAAFSYSKTNSFGIFNNSGVSKYSETEGLRYELTPNLDTKYKLVDFKTNAEGFRDKDHKPSKNMKKVAVLGDSFTMGTGVSENELFVQKTEELLNVPHKTYEFFNFGISGYGLDDYLTILKRNALAHHPDLVIVAFCASNDHKENGVDFDMNDFVIKPKHNVFWDSYLKKLLKIKLAPNTYEPTTYSERQLTFVANQFSELQKVLVQQNSKGIIFYIDLVYDPVRIEQIQTLAKQKDLFFLDVSEDFKDANLFDYILNELDPHPNGDANAIFAKKLQTYISKNESLLFEE
ncbi:SGNH/GDSL hydrolase family protein [uncultured Kordia sp.]|uniref:SGNH/GDSL hydrolase family protein n=1 Tax=uncultured Kordia sp. TaxID=507699 RepID=UPI00260E0EED|nr:SGNH/GDSL hydrolase family protein [uncultured Kordia sp.]